MEWYAIKLQSFYRENVFPIVREFGFIPVTPDDIIAPGDNWIAKFDAVVARARIAIVEASTNTTESELKIVRTSLPSENICIIESADHLNSSPSDSLINVIQRQSNYYGLDDFLSKLDNWLSHKAKSLQSSFEDEPTRLLKAKEYRAAIISSITLLETTLREIINAAINVELLDQASISSSERKYRSPRSFSLRALVEYAIKYNLIAQEKYSIVREWISLRNEVVHLQKKVTREEASSIVNGVKEILDQMQKPQKV